MRIRPFIEIIVAKESFVHGTDRVARVTVSSTAPLEKINPDEATFFLYDHLGNTRVAFSVDGSNVPLIVNALDYYSYGKILREYDNGAGDRYLTTQHERDKETGLDYRGARYYDSDVARFLSLDPLASKYPAWSPYNYVMSNPLMLIDPNGKAPGDPPSTRVNKGEGPSQFAAKNGMTLDELATLNPDVFKNYSKYENKNDYWKNVDKNWSIHPGQELNVSESAMEKINYWNDRIAFFTSPIEYVPGTFRLMTSGSAVLSPKYYSSGWRGGSAARISTYKFTSLGKGIGYCTGGLSIGYNTYGAFNYLYYGPKSPNAIHPGAAGLSIGFTIWTMFTPYAGPAGIIYSGVELFYPGGWTGDAHNEGAIRKMAGMHDRNKAILQSSQPFFNLHRDPGGAKY